MTMGEKIYKLRRDRNMTQEELARRVGVSYQAINKYEHGRVTNIPIERLERIAFALGTTTNYLRGGGLLARATDPYDEFLDDVDMDELTEDDIKRRRMYSIISHAHPAQLDTYMSIVSLPYDRLEALARLLDVQGGRHGQN